VVLPNGVFVIEDMSTLEVLWSSSATSAPTTLAPTTRAPTALPPTTLAPSTVRRTYLSDGQTLAVDEVLYSADGAVQMRVQTDDNVCAYGGNGVSHNQGYYCAYQDLNFRGVASILFVNNRVSFLSSSKQVVFQSPVVTVPVAPTRFIVLRSGAFAVVDFYYKVLWISSSQPPRTSLTSGQSLVVEEALYSATGNAYLRIQNDDGNVCSYGGSSIYCSGVTGVSTIRFDSNRVSFVDAKGAILFQSPALTTSATGRFVVLPNGVFVIEDMSTLEVLWSSSATSAPTTLAPTSLTPTMAGNTTVTRAPTTANVTVTRAPTNADGTATLAPTSSDASTSAPTPAVINSAFAFLPNLFILVGCGACLTI